MAKRRVLIPMVEEARERGGVVACAGHVNLSCHPTECSPTVYYYAGGEGGIPEVYADV